MLCLFVCVSCLFYQQVLVVSLQRHLQLRQLFPFGMLVRIREGEKEMSWIRARQRSNNADILKSLFTRAVMEAFVGINQSWVV